MNLLISLKNGRFFKKNAAGSGLLLVSFILGAAFFYFFGSAAYFCFENSLSNFAFCIVYIAIFAIIFISAFSQFGILQICISCAAFAFALITFSAVRILHLSPVSLKSMLILGAEEFLLIFFTVLFSQRAMSISTQLLKRTVNDKRFFAALSANYLIFLAFFVLLLLICITAF